MKRRSNPWIAASGFALLAMTVLIILSTPALAQDITTGLVGHWKLDETSGNSLIDPESSANLVYNGNGTCTNVNTGAGIVSSAVNMLSDVCTGNYSDSGDLFSARTNFSVAGWVKFDSLNGELIEVFAKRLISAPWHSWGILLDPTDQLGFVVGNTSPTTLSAIWDGPVIANEWYHFAGVKEGTSLKIYINGVDSTDTGGTYSGTEVTGTHTLIIGEGYGGDTTNFFADDFRFYNRALSAEDIAVLASGVTAGGMRYNDTTEAIEYHDGYQWVHAGLGSYNPNAVEFDGTNDYLRHPGNMSGITDGKTGTVSFWINADAAGTDRAIYDKVQDYFAIKALSYGEVMIKGENAASTQVFRLDTSSFSDDTDGWHHIMASWDLSDPAKRHLYLDGVSDINVIAYVDDVINYADATDTHSIGTESAGANDYDGMLADFWLDFNTYIDLSVEANRRKFLSANGMPMYLGPDGSLPLGKAPDIFLSGDTDDWHTNKGTGGGFTENGALTTSPSQPGKSSRLTNVASILDYDSTNLNGVSKVALDNSETFAYVPDWGSGNKLDVFNVSDPSTITHVGSLSHASLTNSWGIVTDGDYAYICAGGGGLIIIDISNRENPSYISSFNTSNTCLGAGDLVKIGGYVYAAGFDQDGISIVDVSTPSTPNLVGTVTNAGMDGATGIDVDLDTGYAYLSAWNIDRFAVVDISTPSAPTYVTNLSNAAFGEPEDIRIHPTNRDIVYVGNGTVNGVAIVDVSNPASPSVVGSITDGNMYGPEGLHIMDNSTLLVAGNGALLAYDITNAASPAKIDDFVDLNAINQGVTASTSSAFTVSDNTSDEIVSWELTVAGCSAPVGRKGSIIYNTDELVMQYCNGVDWVAMGPVGGTGGGGCTNPAGSAGDLIYNEAYKTMQYCNSEDWVSIGKTFTIPTEGLVGYWKLDDGTGSSTAIDSSGNGNTGTLVSMETGTDWVTGKRGGALDFDATYEYVNAGSAAILDDMGDMSICAWVRPSAIAGTYYGIAAKSSGASNGWQFYLARSGGTGIAFFHTMGEGVEKYSLISAPDIWHHACATWDGTDGGAGVSLYFDTVLQTGASVITYASPNSDAAYDLDIGSFGGAPNPFQGDIDEVMVYNRVLSASEITQIYNATR